MQYPFPINGRLRSKPSSSVSTTYPGIWYRNGSLYATFDRTHVTHLSSCQMYDYVTSDFLKQRSAGVVVNNPMISCNHESSYSATTFYMKCLEGSIVNDYTGRFPQTGKEGEEGGVLPIPNLTTEWNRFDSWQSYQDRAVTSSWANVDESEMAALASLGELPETLAWLTSILQRGVNTVSYLKRKKNLAANERTLSKAAKKERARRESLAKARKAQREEDLRKAGKSPAPNPSTWDRVKDVGSDSWLEWRYAMRPLIFEAESALKALKTIVDKGLRKTARGFDSTSSTTTSEYTNTGMMEVKVTRTVEKRYNCRAGVLYNISADINNLLAVWGFDQPLEAVYELTRFSFILDWFFNVGNVISSWSIAAGLTPLTSWFTEELFERTRDYVAVIRPTWSLGTVTEFTYVPGHFTSVVLTKRRVVNPPRTFIPKFKLKLDTSKLLDLATIGRSLLKTK